MQHKVLFKARKCQKGGSCGGVEGDTHRVLESSAHVKLKITKFVLRVNLTLIPKLNFAKQTQTQNFPLLSGKMKWKTEAKLVLLFLDMTSQVVITTI